MGFTTRRIQRYILNWILYRRHICRYLPSILRLQPTSYKEVHRKWSKPCFMNKFSITGIGNSCLLKSNFSNYYAYLIVYSTDYL